MKTRLFSAFSMTFHDAVTEEAFASFYTPILKKQFCIMYTLCFGILVTSLAFNKDQIDSLPVLISAIVLLTLFLMSFFYINRSIHHYFAPFCIVITNALIYATQKPQDSLYSLRYQFTLICAFLLDSHIYRLNILNIIILKCSETYLFIYQSDILYKETTSQFISHLCLSAIALGVLSYMKQQVLRVQFAQIKSGKEWRSIVNEFLPQKVMLTRFNPQTGHLELQKCNAACLEEISCAKSIHSIEFQDEFDLFIQRFKLNYESCVVFKVPVHVADADRMVNLKKYLMHRHLSRIEASSKPSLTRISESSFSQIRQNYAYNNRMKSPSTVSLHSNTIRRRRSSSGQSSRNAAESVQVEYTDPKTMKIKTYRMRVDSFGTDGLVIILDDESQAVQITRLKQEKAVLETFLFSLMKNVQEKLRYSVWGMDHNDMGIARGESYMVINQVYCLLDYFVMKAKRVGHFTAEQIQKILHVSSFTWDGIITDLRSLFCDLLIIDDENLAELTLIQDRRKLKQVLIALVSCAQHRTKSMYEIQLNRLRHSHWNAIECRVSFEVEKNEEYNTPAAATMITGLSSNMNAKTTKTLLEKEGFYKYLNGNAIEILNQVEEEVIKETVMLLGPYQIKEVVSEDNSVITFIFSFFEDLTCVYHLSQDAVQAQNQQQLATNYSDNSEYFAHMQEIQMRNKQLHQNTGGIASDALTPPISQTGNNGGGAIDLIQICDVTFDARDIHDQPLSSSSPFRKATTPGLPVSSTEVQFPHVFDTPKRMSRLVKMQDNQPHVKQQLPVLALRKSGFSNLMKPYIHGGSNSSGNNSGEDEQEEEDDYDGDDRNGNPFSFERANWKQSDSMVRLSQKKIDYSQGISISGSLRSIHLAKSQEDKQGMSLQQQQQQQLTQLQNGFHPSKFSSGHDSIVIPSSAESCAISSSTNCPNLVKNATSYREQQKRDKNNRNKASNVQPMQYSLSQKVIHAAVAAIHHKTQQLIASPSLISDDEEEMQIQIKRPVSRSQTLQIIKRGFAGDRIQIDKKLDTQNF